eukprot:CAMPEP_0201609474 /NCGR_PEP_ID=MMETSP0492-20130828/13681_1 /ASSEMBLY_ACC=CAM_ASM_000837 /TAXON_ID=420259 /ORGANISM="Thalassiosira gravida, Strain GMp14c1" /LENGTH=91 /DNA_ID=CAMNT_0048074947 /DNA_START=468 /DNA_END=743 /DNA_ORIENTATION=-
MANIRPPALLLFPSPPELPPMMALATADSRCALGGTNSVTCPPLAINPRTTPSSILVATTSIQDPGTNDPFTLESNRPPSVITHPGSATTT